MSTSQDNGGNGPGGSREHKSDSNNYELVYDSDDNSPESDEYPPNYKVPRTVNLPSESTIRAMLAANHASYPQPPTFHPHNVPLPPSPQLAPTRHVSDAASLHTNSSREEDEVTSQAGSSNYNNGDHDSESAIEFHETGAAKVLQIDDIEKRITERVTKEVEERVAIRVEILYERIRQKDDELALKDQAIKEKEELIAKLLSRRQ